MIVWQYGKKWQLLLFLVLAGTTSLVNVAMAWIVTRFVAAAMGRDLGLFIRNVGIGAVIFISVGILNWLLVSCNALITRTVNVRVKAIMIQYIADDRPLTANSGAMVSFMTNDLKLLEEKGIANELVMSSNALLFIGALGGAASFDWLTATAFLIGNLLPAMISFWTQGTVSRAARAWSTANAAWTGQLKDFLAGLDTARTYQANGVLKARVGGLGQQLEQRLFHMTYLTAIVAGATMIVSSLCGMLLPYGVGIWRIIRGASTLAKFMGVLQLANSMRTPLLTVLDGINQWGAVKPIKQKIQAVQALHAAKRKADQSGPRLAGGPLQLRDVSVRIGQKTLLSHLNLTINPGEHVLLMAPSGFGKSTLLRVLQGEIPLASGTYTIGGVTVGEVPRTRRRQYFGLIKQTPFLFDDTIRYNLTLGAQFSASEITAAVQQAGLSQLVAEKGLTYRVGENGRNLSGGQSQRVEIARALLRRRPVLLADEAASALDDRLARQVRQEFLTGPETLIEVGHQVPVAVQGLYDQVIHLDTAGKSGVSKVIEPILANT
ncbi:ATP-binding cassette domain-containing protein [Schleiferilactobacillus harbinensis]|jgi:ABC-type multidrug transport system fused ATPase/permease subunit|uniref:ATP-binding cassette domain-containing protein n=1 Tax=Schleiferilactobacillus harbinensis TaxID=304207 RepID=UPI0026735865|nr:ABC transporter ATP-binding protein [Schleiferilactobacillus harbinensis]MCI1688605.1 ABC transporter ATP-binding protein/permease [Schleiferilactobacillus harbinensis]